MRTLQKARRRKHARRSVGRDCLAPKFRRSLIEQLEQRRLLANNAFSSFSGSLQSEVASIQSAVDNVFQTASSLKSLPFIGQQLGAIDQAQSFLDNVGNKIQSELATISNASPQPSDLQNALWGALGTGNGGLGVVSSKSNIIVDASAFQTDGQGVVTAADVEIWIHEAPTAINQSLTFNLGLPALPFKVTTTGGLTVSVGLDLDLAMDYSQGSITIDSSKSLQDFNSSLPAAQLSFGVTAGLSSNASLTATLGLLQGTLTPTPGQANSLSASVTVANLASPTPSFTGSANINLTATLGFGDGSGGQAFPSISTDLTMSWPDLTSPASLNFSYGNVQLNLGQFISNLVEPVIADIQQYTKPFESAIDALNTPIPGIDSILPGFSLMTLAGGVASYTGWGEIEGLVADAIQIANLVNGFNVSSLDDVMMPMGDFSLNGSAIASASAALDPTVLSNLADNLSNLDLSDLTSSAQDAISNFASGIESKISGAIAGAGLPSGVASAATACLDALAAAVTGSASASAKLDFPLFDNPSSIVNLLFGKDVNLITFDAGFNLSVPAVNFPSASFAGLGVNFTSSVTASASLELGYDTYGLRQLLGNIENGTATAGTIATDILDGFYIQGPSGSNLGSYAKINGQIGVFAGGEIGIGGIASASLGFFGGLTGNLSVSLNNQYPDTSNDGRIRYQELGSEIANGQVFDASGELTAGLSIIATGSIGPLSVSDTLLNIASVTLFNSASVSNNTVADTSPPTVSSVAPASGPLEGGTSVAIYGTNLDGATEVDFSGEPSPTIVSDSATCIVAVSPADTVGTKDITVVTPNGTSATSANDQFTYVEPPIFGSLGTSSGPAAGGEYVDINGLYLENATAVDFGNNQATIISDTNTEIVAAVPPGSGSCIVTVTTGGGTVDSPGIFTYIPAPIITSVSPAVGPEGGGTLVTIFGANLDNAWNLVFGENGVPKLITETDTEIQVDSPGSTTVGAVNVQVATNGGPSATSSAGLFTYGDAPIIEGVAPGSGPQNGTNQVVIPFIDEGGQSASDFTGVDFGQKGGTIDSIVEVSPPGSFPTNWVMTATAPAGAGTVDVEIDSVFGKSIPIPADQYVYTPPPGVTSISPSAGPLGGGTLVLITGVNLGNEAVLPQVKFGNNNVPPAAVTVYLSGTVAAYSPAGSAGTVPVHLTTAGGTVDAGNFTYTAAPIVTSVSPDFGPNAGGTEVTIAGATLAGATAVDFGANPAMSFTVLPNGSISAESPSGQLGVVDVTVTTAAGKSATSYADKFSYELVPPVIDGLSTTTGSVTGGTTVYIYGANFTSATEIDFDSTLGDAETTNFTVLAPGEIEVVTPPHVAAEVAVVVKTPGEQSIFSYPDQFTYTAVAAVTGISPSSGLTGGGTSVTISGTDLAGATAVDFGNAPASGFVVNPDGTITAVSPAEDAGPVNITVTTPTGPTQPSSADLFTYLVSGPIVDQVSPDTGSPSGGTTVTITGANFAGATEVEFGNTAASSFTIDSNSSITATSPGGTAGSSVDVTVVTAGGASPNTPNDMFVYGAAPVIFFVGDNGNAGPANASNGVFIYGANLEDATGVNFGPYVDERDTGVGEILTINPNGTELSVSVPAEPAGTVDVTVTTSNGGTSAITPNDKYTYVSGPLLDFVVTGGVDYFPASGPVGGGTTVELAGYNLGDATAVNFGGTPATSFAVNDNGDITAVSPSGVLGTVDVTVTSPQGTSSTAFFPNYITYTYLAAPIVSGIAPASGPVAGGNTVEIFGAALASVSEIDFGGVPGTITGISNNALYATAPAGTLGTVNITVTTLGGTSATLPADNYTYMPPPVFSTLDVSSGAIEGGTPVTITGTNLAGATEVDFGQGNPATILDDTGSQIIVTSPYSPTADVGTVDVTVTTPDGTTAVTEPADEFTYTHAPFISQVAGAITLGGGQAAGFAAGGDSVNIQGVDLSYVTAVDFGSTPAELSSLVYNPDGSITVDSPAGAPGTVNITVTTSFGTSDISMADQFTYFAVPSISSVSPATGGIDGGTHVVITGTGFAGATQVDFKSSDGDNFATIDNETDDQLIVTSPVGSALGAVDIIVITPGGTSAISTADQFMYMPSPNVDTLGAIDSGSVFGGDLVTIYGENLADAQAVLFGANAGTIIGNTDGQIQVVSPEATGDIPGTVDVTVMTQYGMSLTTYSDEFTYALPPDVTSIDQSTGPAAGGTFVTIYGNNLTGVTEVDFGGIAASSIYFNGYLGAIQAESPAGVGTVDITVITPGGTSPTTSADQFTYLAAPSVSSISPSAGPIGGGTQITITGTDLGSASQVDFNDGLGDDYLGTIVSYTDTQVIVTSPDWGYEATVDLVVTTPGGVSATTPADQFTYANPPSVSGLDISSGFTSGGDLVTITGNDFDGASTVNFGTTAGTIIGNDGTQIQAISPSGAGTVDVTVVTPGGSSSTSSADQFTYVPLAPVVEGLSQSTGAYAGGTTVTITGANLADASAVDFGDSAGTIVIDAPTQIVVTSPAGFAGTVDVTVATSGGTSDTSQVDQFTYISAPAVSALGLSTGSAAGGDTVYIYGSDLDGASAVDFGNAAGTIVDDASTYIIATSPAGAAGTVDVTVTTPYGSSATSSADQFTYVGLPMTTSESYTTEQDTTLSVAGPGVLAGDSDPQGLALVAELLTNPTFGTLSFGADGSFSYTPEAGYFGTDSFTYQADNGYVVSSPTTVSLTIIENNPLATQVTNTADSGPGSLRQAMLIAAADTSGNPYTIQFALSAGPQTIVLQSALPTPTDPVVLELDAAQNVTVDLDGSVSVLTEGVNILNDSTAAAGIEVSGTNQVVGGIDGTGNLVVDAGGNLTAHSIVQNTLSIGAGATVTIAPSGSGSGSAEPAASDDQTAAGTNPAAAARLAAVAARRQAEEAVLLLAEGESQTAPTADTASAPANSDSSAAPVVSNTATAVAAIGIAPAEPTNAVSQTSSPASTVQQVAPLLTTTTDTSSIEAVPVITTVHQLTYPPQPVAAVPAYPVVDHLLEADNFSARSILAPPVPTSNSAATVLTGGSALSAGRESRLSQLFQEFGEGTSGEGVLFDGPTSASFAEISQDDATAAGPTHASQNTSRTIFETLGLDFAATNGSRRTSGGGIASDSVTTDWSDEFLYEVSAFGDSSTETD